MSVFTKQRVTDVENNITAVSGDRRGRDKFKDWDLHIHTPTYKIGN